MSVHEVEHNPSTDGPLISVNKCGALPNLLSFRLLVALTIIACMLAFTLCPWLAATPYAAIVLSGLFFPCERPGHADSHA